MHRTTGLFKMLLEHLSLARRAEHPEPSPPEESFKHFLALPGEIRNQIYNLLLIPSIGTSKSPPSSIQIFTPPFPLAISKSSKLSITAVPHWGEYPIIRIKKIGLLQILLVNKQIHGEVSTLLYSHAEDLTVGGYILQFRDEDPTMRWKTMFQMLERRPGLLQSVKNLTIRMPSQREDLLKGHWRYLGFLRPPREKTVSPNLWAGIPDMVDFVQKFQSLEKIHIVATVEGRDPPSFEDLLGLFAAGQGLTSNVSMEFVVAVWDSRRSMAILEKWNDAWKKLMAEKEVIDSRLAVERSMIHA